MAKKKLKLSIFYTLYAVLTIAVLLAIALGVNSLWKFLDDYEKALPKYVAERIFAEYYSPCDFVKLSDVADLTINEYETMDHFSKYMENKVAGKQLTYYEISAGLGDIKKYVVKAGDEKISDFTIKKSGSKSAYGFDLWTLDNINLTYSANESVTFTIIKGGSLTVNGHTLDLSKCTLIEDNIPTYSHGHMLEGSGAEPITYATYKISGFLLPPTLASYDRNGKETSLTLDPSTGIYKEEITYDEKLKEEKLQITTEAAEVYLNYITNDTSLYILSFYFDKASEIYQKVKATDTRWVAPHIRCEFRNAEMSEFYAYSNDTFSCRYTCTHTIVMSNSEAEWPTDITFYFRVVGEDTLIYDFVQNK